MSSMLRAMLIWQTNDNDSDSEAESDSSERDATPHQKKAIRLSLEQYRSQLSEELASSPLTTDPDVLHGFTSEVMESIVNRCAHLKSADEVLARCGVWSYTQARTVYDILCSVLEMDALDTDSDHDYTDIDD